MKPKKREEKLTDGFLFDGFDFKGVHYKPLTAQSLTILQKVKSPIYTGTSEDNWMETILDYMFVTSKPLKEILAAIGNWQETLLIYADGFSYSDLKSIGEIVNDVLEQSTSAIVETRGDEDDEKKPVIPHRG